MTLAAKKSRWRRAVPIAALALAPLLALAGCAEPGLEAGDGAATSTAPTEDTGPLVVYSGRNKSLIGPVLDRFTQKTGIETKVRYGETAEMAATILEEGAATPADVFVGQDAAALGAVAAAGMFHPVPEEIAARVPARFGSGSNRDWVGLSGRVRTVVYNTERMQPEDLPRSLEQLTDPRYRRRFGVAPANGSFQAHMAVYRVVRGSEALMQLLEGITANEPRRYPNNGAIVEAVLAGEVDFGLVNHYYLRRALAERPDAPGANYVFPEGEASSFANVAGAGLLGRRVEAARLVEYLLSDEAQQYFARETFEYPLVPGVAADPALQPLAGIRTPEVDFGRVAKELHETLTAIRKSGLLP